MHFGSKCDSIHICEIPFTACEPLYSKCSADKSLTSIFYSWGPSQPGYHFHNSPCASTSYSVGPVPLRPWEMSKEVIFSPLPWLLHNLSWLFFYCQRWFDCIFIFSINSCGSKFRHSSYRDGKSRQGRDSYAEVKPRREWRNQGLIWSQCVPMPKPSGSLRLMGLLRQSYITFHLYQINWLVFDGQLLPCTLFDTLMDNGETLPPYGKKILYDL